MVGSNTGGRAVLTLDDSDELDMHLVYRNINPVAKMPQPKRTKAAEAAFDTQAC